MEKNMNLQALQNVSLCAYGPGMTTTEVLAIAQKAHKLNASTLFLQELDAHRLHKGAHPMSSIGLMASLPFAGVALEDTIRLLKRAEALGCKAFAFGLPIGIIKDDGFAKLEEMIRLLRESTDKVELYPTLGTSHISEEQVLKAVKLCLDEGCRAVCLGTGTSLDSVQEETLEALLAKGVSLSSLEIGVSDRHLLDPKAEKAWLLTGTVPLRICSSTLTLQDFPLQFTALTQKEPSHDA